MRGPGIDRPRAARRRTPRFPFACILAAALGGCAGGDFGRARSTFLTDDAHSWIGVEATESVGEPASAYQLTDEERALRDLAYPFIEPPGERPAFAGVFGDYARYPAPWRQPPQFDRAAYGMRLMNEARRSPSSRYGQLIEDVRDNVTRLEQFLPVAMRVLDLDAKRNASLAYVTDLSPRERDDAIARMRENALIVKWVARCLNQRAASYRWALERLVIAAPDPRAVDAERAITLLVQRIAEIGIGEAPVVGRAPASGTTLSVRG